MSTIYGQRGTIEIAFPEEKFEKYLQKLSLESIDNASLKDKRKIFLYTIQDFKKGSVALDELSEISNFLWSTEEDKTSDLADILYNCAELNFEIRNITDENDSSFVGTMVEIMKYYEKHKAVL